MSHQQLEGFFGREKHPDGSIMRTAANILTIDLLQHENECNTVRPCALIIVICTYTPLDICSVHS